MRRDFVRYLGAVLLGTLIASIALFMGIMLFEWLVLGVPGLFGGHVAVTGSATAQPPY